MSTQRCRFKTTLQFDLERSTQSRRTLFILDHMKHALPRKIAVDPQCRTLMRQIECRPPHSSSQDHCRLKISRSHCADLVEDAGIALSSGAVDTHQAPAMISALPPS